MSNAHPDPMAVPPEGYDSPASPAPKQEHPYQSAPQAQQPPEFQQQGYPAGPQTPPPYQGHPYPSAPQAPKPPQFPQHGYSAGQQQPYAAQPQYQAYPPGPHQSQPPMPNPAYGYPQAKSKVVAGLLGIFLGPLGIHRFYLGFTKIAVIQLILTLVLGSFGLGFVGLWGVIEGIMILVGSAHFRADARGVPLRD